MEFCPSCGLLLQFELGNINRFRCPVCPYVSLMENKVKIKKKQRLNKKVVDPIVSKGDKTSAPATTEPCPECGHDKPVYNQSQTRSADEAMTIIYRCTNGECGYQWKVEP